jgi:phosphoribosylformimino-5-aminoimidazole carboxamide ribotide isomerase
VNSVALEIIPVIDLQGEKAVRAAGGERARYQPLISPVCADAEPLSAARGLMALAPFARLYLADLDAIEGRSSNAEAVAAIRTAFPGLEL